MTKGRTRATPPAFSLSDVREEEQEKRKVGGDQKAVGDVSGVYLVSLFAVSTCTDNNTECLKSLRRSHSHLIMHGVSTLILLIAQVSSEVIPLEIWDPVSRFRRKSRTPASQRRPRGGSSSLLAS